MTAIETSTGEIFLTNVLARAGHSSEAKLSERVTGSPDTLRNIRRSLAKGRPCAVSSKTVFKFAEALDTTPAALLQPLEAPDPLAVTDFYIAP